MTAPAGAALRYTIDLGALRRNWRRLAAMAAPAECAAAIKADAYGIGAARAVPALAASGCRSFFVALPHEGVAVRAVAPEAAIYVLNGFTPEAAELYRANALRPVLNSEEEVSEWTGWRSALPDQRTAMPAALHVDTGMNRLGLRLEEAERLSGSPLLAQAGIALVMSHLACADAPDHPLNQAQREHTERLRALFPGLPLSLANSAGIHHGAAFHFDMVRPGIALYGGGCHPASQSEPVVTAEARILQVREAGAGETIGYGAARRLARDSRIAILGAGYADGYLRASGDSDARPGASILIAGRHAPLLGRVSMDLIAADVTDIPAEEVRRGGWAELFGPNVSIDDVAAHAGTIAYELLTGLSRRAERRYVENSKPG
ncbi:MAG TPA: alanine racemase [Afifellaceae bacterium]|nr:alanine racemase [Afifellaceae bacterium]